MLRKFTTLAIAVLATIAMALLPVPASANDGDIASSRTASSDYEVEYTIETGPDGVQYKVITKINHKPLVDRQGNPKPLRIPMVAQPMISTTACFTSGGSPRPGPVRVKFGTWAFPDYRCYEHVGTTTVGITGVDEIYGGHWYGTVYYETANACIADGFNPGETISLSNEVLCVLSISH